MNGRADRAGYHGVTPVRLRPDPRGPQAIAADLRKASGSILYLSRLIDAGRATDCTCDALEHQIAGATFLVRELRLRLRMDPPPGGRAA